MKYSAMIVDYFNNKQDFSNEEDEHSAGQL